MKNVILCLWLACFAAPPLIAQTDGSREPRQAKGRIAWFIYTSMPEGLENPVSVITGKDLVQLTLSKRAASEPIKIPADGIIRLVRKVQDPLDPAKVSYLTLAQATIPETIGKALIILVPTAKSPSGLVFQAKVQDLAAFTGGDSMYLNLTKLNIAVEMGATKIGLKPGETKIHDTPNLTTPTNVPIRYLFFHQQQQEWQLLSASTVVQHPTRREICIFSWDTRYERVDYHGITFPVTP